MAAEKLPKGIAPIALIIVLGALPATLDSTIVNVAVNSLAKIFSTNLAVIQWAITGYVLAMGVAVPFSGWLIRKISGKKLFMGALTLFLIGSLLSGISWNVGALIVFRIVQGFAAGIMIPTLTTLIVRLAGSNNLGKLMSLVGIPVVFGPIIGPVAGGLIMQYLPWSWLFFLNLPIGAVGLLLMQWKLPEFEAEGKSVKLDWPGVLLLAVGSVSIIYGVTEVVKAAEHNIGIAGIAAGAAAFAAYIFYAYKNKNTALISLNIFHSKNFSAAFISLFLAGFAINGPMLLFPIFFQNVRGLSVISSALWLIPQGVGMLITRPLIGKLTDRIGARYVVLPSILLSLAGTLPFVFFNAAGSPWLVWGALFVRGMGVGGITVPVMADSYVGLKESHVPMASVATRIIQNLGAAFGSALLATVVSSALAKQAGGPVGAYHARFVTSLAFMAVSIIPALFLTNKFTKEDFI